MIPTPTYAIQLASDALKQPGQRYLVDLRHSNITRSCERLGVDLYLPVERKMVTHVKRKKKIERIFPLIPGYAFVTNVQSFDELESSPGVFAIMRYGAGLPPVEVGYRDIATIKEAEAAINVEYERQQRLSKLDKKAMRQLYPVGSKIAVRDGYLEGQTAIIDSQTGRKTIKAMVEMLGGLVAVELGVDQIELVAAE